MNILISGVGGPTPRSISRSLKHYSEYSGANLIGTDVNPLAYGLYEKELYDKTYVIPRAGTDGYWEALESIIDRHKIDCAMVHPELEVEAWAKRQKAGKSLPAKVLLPDFDMVNILVDKARMTKALEETELVPKSYEIVPDSLDLKSLEEALPYPFWIRSTSGSSGLGSLKVEDRRSLETWLHINPGVDRFIASQFLSGRNLACKMLYWNGKLVRAATGERVTYIMSKVAPSGITGNTAFGRLLNEPSLVEASARALDLLFKYTNTPKHGFFTADFKEDENGQPFITEINVRMVAFNLSFAAAGANFSQDIVQLLSNSDSFDETFKMYEFEGKPIFLRDVDAEPRLMQESELLSHHAYE